MLDLLLRIAAVAVVLTAVAGLAIHLDNIEFQKDRPSVTYVD